MFPDALLILCHLNHNSALSNHILPLPQYLEEGSALNTPMMSLDVAEIGKGDTFSIIFDKRENGELGLCRILHRSPHQSYIEMSTVQGGQIETETPEYALKLSLLLKNICHIRTTLSESLEILSTTHMRLFGEGALASNMRTLETCCHSKDEHLAMAYPKLPIEHTDKDFIFARDGATIKQTTKVNAESASYQITSFANTIYNVLYIKDCFYNAYYIIKLPNKETYQLVTDVADIEWIESVVQDYNTVQNFQVRNTPYDNNFSHDDWPLEGADSACGWHETE